MNRKLTIYIFYSCLKGTSTRTGMGHVNFLTSHGKLMLEQTRVYEETCITYNLRAAHDTCDIHRGVMNSTSKSAIKRLSRSKEECTISNHVSSNCLLKILVLESGLDTKTTVTCVRTSLSNLSTYMNGIDDVILKFNTHVK